MICGKLTEKKYKLAMEFVRHRTISTHEKLAKYAALSPEEKYKYDLRFKQLRDALWPNFKRIVEGRIASMGLYRQYADHISDLTIDAVMTVFNYINRYDEHRNTSAFAFVTEQAFHSIVAGLNDINARAETLVTGLDFFENINTIDSPTAAFTATNKFIKYLDT